MTVVDGSTTSAARRNRVLAALVSSDHLPAAVELVTLDNHDVVHEIGQPTAEVVFPVSCVVSLAVGECDDVVDVTTIGREGLVGLTGVLGGDVHDSRAVCRVPGQALRLPISSARQLLVEDAEGLEILHRYISASLGDLVQRLACNRLHSSEQRCACWLLKTADRVGDDSFRLTHATLSTMLGVRRATVTDSLARLQRDAVVRSQHGTVTVLDRAALAAAACDCYRIFTENFPSTSV